MPIPSQLFETVTLTGIINDIKRPARFHRDLLVRNRVSLPNQTFEIGRRDRGRIMAPFTPPNVSAHIIGRRSKSVEQYTAPNIRIKRSINPGDFMFERDIGEDCFITTGQTTHHTSRLVREVTETLEDLEDAISNSEEWIVTMAATTGQVAYSHAGEDAYLIDYHRPPAHNAAAFVAWNLPGTFPVADFLTAARLMAEEENVQGAVCVMPRPVAERFLQIPEVQLLMDNRRIDIGMFDLNFATAFQEDGTRRYIGRFLGFECWEYNMVLSRVDGTAVNMLQPDTVYFYAPKSQCGLDLHYAAIPDMDAMRSAPSSAMTIYGAAIGERFAKSWGTPDPTSHWILAQSRPIPRLDRPGAMVSMLVL